MQLNILLFGIARDIVGDSKLSLELQGNVNVEMLLEELNRQYSDFSELKSLMVAVNNEYAQGSLELKESDEIALIPPVSGG